MANAEVASYADIVSACAEAGYGKGNIKEYITKACEINNFNPVTEWIECKRWDGKDRLSALCASITQRGEEDDVQALELKCLKIRRWLISAVAAAYTETGLAVRGVLVIQGKQFVGKTEWFKSLVPAHLGVTKDGVTLRLDDKDSITACISNWLVELGELDATFRKSDIAQLKSFIGLDRDVLRLPFAPRKCTFPRQTVFFASVNEPEFLHDPTGNTRFWVIDCVEINPNHGLDMQQVWAQVKSLFDAGETYKMTREEMQAVNEKNEQFQSIDPIYEQVQSFYDWSRQGQLGLDDGRWRSATEIAIEIGIKQPSRNDVTAISAGVRRLNGGLSKREPGTGKRLLLVPPPVGKDWSQ